MINIKQLRKKIYNRERLKDKTIITLCGFQITKRNLVGQLDLKIEQIFTRLLNKVQDDSQYVTLRDKIDKLLDSKVKLKPDQLIDFCIQNLNNIEYKKVYYQLHQVFENLKITSLKEVIYERIDAEVLKNFAIKHSKNVNTMVYLLSDINLQLDNMAQNNIKKINISDIYKLQDMYNIIIIVAYNKDYFARIAISELQKYNLQYVPLTQANSLARYVHINELAYETLLSEYAINPKIHFCPVDFENIIQAIEATKNLVGDIVEIGTFQGSSARMILHYLKNAQIKKECHFLDTFEGFTYEEAQNSLDSVWKNTHTQTSIEEVYDYLSEYENFSLIKTNIISNKLPSNIDQIVLANIDVDLYEAVKSALYKVKDKMVKNGIVIAEDYGHTPYLIGAQKATIEFLEENPDDFIPLYFNSGQLFLIKK